MQLLYTPVASCECNSVETAFSLIKRAYRKAVTKIALRRDYDEATARACLTDACAQVSPETQRNLCRANWDYLNAFLPTDKTLVKQE